MMTGDGILKVTDFGLTKRWDQLCGSEETFDSSISGVHGGTGEGISDCRGDGHAQLYGA